MLIRACGLDIQKAHCCHIVKILDPETPSNTDQLQLHTPSQRFFLFGDLSNVVVDTTSQLEGAGAKLSRRVKKDQPITAALTQQFLLAALETSTTAGPVEGYLTPLEGSSTGPCQAAQRCQYHSQHPIVLLY